MQRAFETEPQHNIHCVRASSFSRTPHPHPAPATWPSLVCFAVLAWAMWVLLNQWQQLLPQGCDFAGNLAPVSGVGCLSLAYIGHWGQLACGSLVGVRVGVYQAAVVAPLSRSACGWSLGCGFAGLLSPCKKLQFQVGGPWGCMCMTTRIVVPGPG
jgi:hypothetical protein